MAVGGTLAAWMAFCPASLGWGEPARMISLFTSLGALAMSTAPLCAGVGLGVGLAGLRASGGYCPK